jgi:hypothetical protein
MEWIRQKKLTLYLIAPAVLEGGLKRPPLALANAGEALAEIFERFITDPDIENLVTAAAASQRHGVPSEIIPSIIEVLARIRQGTANLDDKVVQHALTMCAHLTLLTSNAALADGVVQTVLDCSRGVTRRHAVDEAAFRIIEVSGALGDPAARQALLC